MPMVKIMVVLKPCLTRNFIGFKTARYDVVAYSGEVITKTFQQISKID